MAAGQQDLSSKKSNFLSDCVAAAQSLKTVRDVLHQLAEMYNADATYSGITQNDITGANSHLTPTVVANFLTVLQPAVESPINAHLANLLDVLPN
jgi:hypothetical protein